MKRENIISHILLLNLIMLSFCAISQPSKVSYLLSGMERVQIDKYELDPSLSFIIIESAFSSDSMELINLEGYKIVKIDYIYTSYKHSSSFIQKKLDLVRFARLFKACPALNGNDLIHWNIYEQTGCDSPKECKNFTHGFVIYYEPEPSKESTELEIERIISSLEKLEETISKSDSARVINYQEMICKFPGLRRGESFVSKKIRDIYGKKRKNKGTYNVHYDIDNKGRVKDVKVFGYLPEESEDLEKLLKRYTSFAPASIGLKKMAGKVFGTITFPLNKKSLAYHHFEFDKEASKNYILDTSSYSHCAACKVDTTYPGLINKSDYKSFTSILERNPDWKSDLIVVDVTGSMYPYTVDMLTWLRLKSIEGQKQFVFFNDGDDKANCDKKIGTTGGIYGVRTSEFAEVKETMIKAMSGGGGGDLPENNTEALLSGKKMCSECKDVIMVADNYAFPRDTELFRKYSGNLKIILCGTNFGINPAYLDLARKYKFSIHTMSTDLERLFELHEGASIEVDGITYQILKNRFVRVYGS